MTKTEAYRHLSSAWGLAEQEFGSFDKDFDECIRCFVSEEDLRLIQSELETEYQRHLDKENEEARELAKVGVYIPDSKNPEYPWEVNMDFFNRDPDGYRKLRDETIQRFRERKSAP